MRDEVSMCSGDRLIADFIAGTDARPKLPEPLEEHLTMTADGLWVVWAYKLARQEGGLFMPLMGGAGYPADATATCRFRGTRRDHKAPDPTCTCGFHALSSQQLGGLGGGAVTALTVALSGRVLAFEWAGGGVLWRAQRQTVVRVHEPGMFHRKEGHWAFLTRRPEDPDGRTAALSPTAPHDSGPIRLKLPVAPPVLPLCHDDAGWCVITRTVEYAERALNTSATRIVAQTVEMMDELVLA